MLAPIDKLSIPGGNRIMDIEVTRACEKTCGNCTRLLQFRGEKNGLSDPVHMSLNCFRDALRSLEGWPGTYTLIGGNPCSRRDFPDLCEIIAEEVPNKSQRGLWTNNLLGHGKIVAQTFGVFNLNVHHDTAAADEMRLWLPGRPVYGERGYINHSQLLADYHDYGYSEVEWIEKREACDINRHWSGTIREVNGAAYGWFCEFASMIDAVRGENNGLKVYPGWWKLSMDSFSHQVSGCCDKGCGVPLKLRGRADSDPIYDISPSLVQLMIPKRGKVSVESHELEPSHVAENTDYAGLRT